MPFLFKVSFFLKHGIGGHSFSLFRQDDGYNDALARSRDLLKVYMPLLGTGTECNYIRVSRNDIPGDARVTAERRIVIGGDVTAPLGAIQHKAVVADPPDPQFTALLINLGSSATAKGRHFMRLIPDISVAEGGVFQPSLDFTKQFDKLKDELTKNTPWGIMHVPVGPDVRKPVVVIEETNGLYPVVETSGPHGFTVGAKIRIGGLKGAAADKFNITTTVKAVVSAVRFSLNEAKGTANNEYTQNPPGYACSVEKAFAPLAVDYIEYVRIVSRRHGRPFGLAVGRRRAKK